MQVQVRVVANNSDLKNFINLPAKIHQNHKNWVPPIYMDDWEFFDSKKNMAFSYCDTILLLAFRGNEAVGRIMGVINETYNTQHGEADARFSFMECENDIGVYNALMHAIEEWARQKGMKQVVGPLAFSDKDPQGFLIEGFDEPVVIASNCNFPYMVDLTNQYGFTKKIDLVVYQIPVPEVLPPIFSKIAERFRKNQSDLKVLEFTSRQKVKPHIHPVLNLVNQTFTDIYGFFPYTDKEMDDVANRFLYLINPRYIKIVVNNKNEVVAFVLGMSDISKGLQKSKGRLLPFGWIHILRESKKSKQLNLLLGAIRPDYQGRGLDILMGAKLLESARATGKNVMDSHLELETNMKIRSEMEHMGGIVYKRFRIWEKQI